MHRRRQIRQATGRTRKQPLRRIQREYRDQRGLTSAQVDLRTLHQHEILSHDVTQATINHERVDLLTELATAPSFEEEDSINEYLDILGESFLGSQELRADLMEQESLHFDVHNDQQVEYDPPSHRTIDEFVGRAALAWTGFTQDQLREIAGHFNMLDGDISLQGYIFTREEIVLFTTVKIKNGANNQQLCDMLFGGCARRWSPAIKWFVKYLDVRYKHILSVVGLDREKENFPRFAQAIARKINMEKTFVDPFTGERLFCDHLALFDEIMFNIFGFIDGTYTKTWWNCNRVALSIQMGKKFYIRPMETCFLHRIRALAETINR